MIEQSQLKERLTFGLCTMSTNIYWLSTCGRLCKTVTEYRYMPVVWFINLPRATSWKHWQTHERFEDVFEGLGGRVLLTGEVTLKHWKVIHCAMKSSLSKRTRIMHNASIMSHLLGLLVAEWDNSAMPFPRRCFGDGRFGDKPVIRHDQSRIKG